MNYEQAVSYIHGKAGKGVKRGLENMRALLERLGITVLLSDLDNTLAPPRTRHPSEEVRGWIRSLTEAGIRFAIVSNNRSSTRVEDYCAELFGAGPEETAMLGDLWTTDILGAKLWGLTMLAVEPVDGAPDWGHALLYALHRPWMRAAKRRSTL